MTPGSKTAWQSTLSRTLAHNGRTSYRVAAYSRSQGEAASRAPSRRTGFLQKTARSCRTAPGYRLPHALAVHRRSFCRTLFCQRSFLLFFFFFWRLFLPRCPAVFSWRVVSPEAGPGAAATPAFSYATDLRTSTRARALFSRTLLPYIVGHLSLSPCRGPTPRFTQGPSSAREPSSPLGPGCAVSAPRNSAWHCTGLSHAVLCLNSESRRGSNRESSQSRRGSTPIE